MPSTIRTETNLDLPAQHAHNPYLLGPFAPQHEESCFNNLEVIGEIPRDLEGTYFRNGPNPKYAPKGRYHWFDGDGMIHALAFRDGKVTYRNRYVQTKGLQAEDETGSSRFSGLIEPDFTNPLGYIKDSANTDLVMQNGKLVSTFYRCGKPYGLDPESLETLGPLDFGGKLKLPISAHTSVDPRTGEMMIFHYGVKAPYMYYGVVSAQGELVNWTPVPLPGPRLPHDMAITQNYSILMDLPVFMDPDALKHGRQRVGYFPEIPTRFAVIPRHGNSDQIRWFEAKPCYIYHVINAWEEGDELVLDACRVLRPVPDRTAKISDLDRMKKVLADALQSARYHRYRFNLATDKTSEEQLWDMTSEFPMVSLDQTGLATRYSYHMSIPVMDTLRFDGLIKYDTATGSHQKYSFGPGRWGSEAPFAPRKNAASEDDGYLVSFVHDEIENRSECLVLNAQNLSDPPVARILIPHRVPLGFHATWANRAQLAGQA